jgi:hypothetical protein
LPVSGSIGVQAFDVLELQSCWVFPALVTLQKSPTDGKVETLQVPVPASMSSKKRRSAAPALTVTLSTDHPSPSG